MSQLLPLANEPSVQAARPPVRELALSAVWYGGMTGSLVTTTGLAVRVVYRGNWSHGFGPDFAGAMLEIDARQVATGSVEIHLNASDWVRHGHHLDPRYNDVVLHVVSRPDLAETRREDGAIVPTVVLDVDDRQLFTIDQELPAIWSELGSEVCAPDLAAREPERLRAALLRLGDARFSQRVTRYAGDLTVEPLPDVLLRGLFDAFGYTMNREPMAELCQRFLDIGGPARISNAQPHQRADLARALLFGLGGFLPISPTDATHAGFPPARVTNIERLWASESESDAQDRIPATAWTTARTRPANHPATRLATLANLIASTGGDPSIRLGESIRDGYDPVELVRQLCRTEVPPELGRPRAIAMVSSVVLPVFMAVASHNEDHELEDAVSRIWAELPRSEWSRPARRALAQAAGEAGVGAIGERALQGLLHLDRSLCGPRRCYECPIAAEVVADRKRQRSSAPAVVQSILPT
jgi:hypothetical protein